MLTAETIHAEGPRYAASIVCVPGLWTSTAAWRGVASYLGHRGWECHLLDACAMPGGIGARAAAVADYIATIGTPAILLAHDAGAYVALIAGSRREPPALVLLAPLSAGSRAARRLVIAPRRLLPLLVGRDVPPPSEHPTWLDLPDALRVAALGDLRPDDAASVRDVVWARLGARRLALTSTLVVAGTRDALLPPEAARTFAHAAGADLRLIEGGGHWLLAGPSWQNAVATVHRWLVQRLGAPLLELYPEAMAERESDEEA